MLKNHSSELFVQNSTTYTRVSILVLMKGKLNMFVKVLPYDLCVVVLKALVWLFGT